MNNIKKYLNNGEVALAIIFIVVFVFFSFASEYFFTLRNIMNVSGQLSIILIASIGFAVLLIAGEVDISIGSLLAFVAIPLVQVMNYTESVALGIVVCLIFGAIIGLINGFLSIYLKISSLIVTLGMLFILRGATLALTRLITGRTQVPGLRVLIENDPIAWIFATDTFKWLFIWLGSMKFIDLRTHEGAQKEIQDVAFACLEIATDLWPESVGSYRNNKGV